MKEHVDKKAYHVEVLPPKQDAKNLDAGLERFVTKYTKVLEAGYINCITDNAMGNLAFQGTELIDEFELPVEPEQVMIHLNTFHSKTDFDGILTSCADKGIKYLLLVTGDGNEHLPKLTPEEVGCPDVESVSSVELLKYVNREYPNSFSLGVAFNPYEPEDHEREKMERKIDAGAEYIITQPVIERHPVVDRLKKDVDLPLVVEAWMSKKLHVLSDAVGYEIPEDTPYDPIENLNSLHENYDGSGFYLALLGFKTQYPRLKEIWK